LPKVLDEILTNGGAYVIKDFQIGQRQEDVSHARIEVRAPSADALRETYDRLEPTMRPTTGSNQPSKSLKGLLRCDRSTFAPANIAGYAQVLEREIKAFFKLLDGGES
jgi:hypothetical protein